MDTLHFNTFITVTGYISLVVSAILVLTSRVKTANLNDLKERVDILEKEREDARSQHVENQKAIANLEGQLQTYKEIPLKSIALSLQALPKIVEGNDKILSTIQGSAVSLSSDTRHASGAVERVRTDLKSSNKEK